MLPQAGECLGLPESGRGKEGYSAEASEGAWPCHLLDFGLLASRSVSEYVSVVLSEPVCGTLLW